MKEPTSDDERLAALLDGKLSEGERNELLAKLAVSRDDYDVFAGAAAMLRELEGDKAVPEQHAPEPKGVIPLRPPARTGRRAPARWLALAAAVAGVAIVTTFAARGRGPDADPVRLAARLEHAQLPSGWTDRDVWSSARGEGDAGPDPAQAVRAGAMLTDLAVAVRARDAAATRLLAQRVHTRYDAQSPAGAFRQLAERAGAPADSLAPLLSTGTERLEERFGRDFLQLGAWLEAASLAAHARDEAFFRDRAMLRRAERLAGDDAAAGAALSRVRSALPDDGPPRWDSLPAAVDGLLRELASE